MSEESQHTLRRALARLVDGLTVDALLFTTFTFEPEFFESNVLPVVTDVEHVATIRELHAISHQADQLGVVVFHDGRAHGRKVKRATYPTEAVFLEDGVFHPKVIIASGHDASGKPETRLMVSSANLSFAGWGHQREAVASTVVSDRSVAEPLARLLRWLEKSASDDASRERVATVLSRLEPLSDLTDDGLELHVSLPEHAPSLASTLAKDADELIIAAPFFSPGFSNWLLKVAGDRPVTVIPAETDGQVDLLDSELQALFERPNRAVRRLSTATPERHDHLKLWHSGRRLYVGSHNATIAALGWPDGRLGQNVEASLSFPCDQFPHAHQEFETLPTGKSASEKAEDRELLLSSLASSVTVTLRWTESRYEVRVGKELDRYSVRLPAIEGRVKFSDADYPIGDAREVAQLLQGRRVFQVWAGEEPIHEGFINEVGWREVRPVGEFASLRDCFDAWRTSGVKQAASRKVVLIGGADDDDVDAMVQFELKQVVADDLLETYFSFFRAIRGLRKAFADAVETANPPSRLLQLFERAPGSLKEAHQHVAKEMKSARDIDEVFWFVVAHELHALAEHALSLCDEMPEVRERAVGIAGDFAGLVADIRGREWFKHISTTDREQVGFILGALGYGGRNATI